jgi:hypothetical protein
LSGVLAAWLLRRSDPLPPRRRYSWELEDDAARDITPSGEHGEELEPLRPDSVPVLWQRPAGAGNTVVPFRRAN